MDESFDDVFSEERIASLPCYVWLKEAQETLQTAIMLHDEPESEDKPFEAKYKSRALLVQLAHDFEAKEGELPEPLQAVCTARILYFLGRNHTETEELTEGQRVLEKALAALANLASTRAGIAVAMATLNQSGIVWAGLKEHDKSLAKLQKAYDLYSLVKTQDKTAECWMPHELVPSEAADKRLRQLESAHTHSLFYLAQCYGNLGQAAKSAEYCFLTLKRQYGTGEYNNMEWALNAAAISQYYLGVEDFQAARHCLACAMAVSARASVDESDAAAVEDKQQKDADIAICCLKLHLQLLETGSDILLAGAEKPEASTDMSIAFNMEDAKEYEKDIISIPRSYADAKVIFVQALRYLKIAQAYYVLDGHATDYIKTVQDHSKLFKYLALFEADADTASKMHKRRADALTSTVQQLNTQYYLAVCKQLHYELGEVYAEMATLKRSKQQGAQLDAHAVMKINKLVQLAIRHFNTFLDLHRDKDGQLPDPIDPPAVKSIMVAHFMLARLHTMVLSDRDGTVAALRAGLKHHEYIVQYDNKHTVEGMTDELAITREMVQLLPLRIKKIMTQD